MPKAYSKEILQTAYDLITVKEYSANKAAKELGIDCGTMRKRLKEQFGLEFLPDGKKQVDSHYFDTIDTEEKAYWLGFLTADGYVSDTNTIELCLAETDKEHVEKFKKAISSKHSISLKKVTVDEKVFLSYRISIKDTVMANALRSYGLTSDKSYTAYIPEIPNEFIRHYIRGLFDGDGSIMTRSSNHNLFDISIISGSPQMIDDFCNVVKKYIGIDMNIRLTRGLTEARLSHQYKIKSFVDWIYGESTIYLDRKYNKIIAVLG